MSNNNKTKTFRKSLNKTKTFRKSLNKTKTFRKSLNKTTEKMRLTSIKKKILSLIKGKHNFIKRNKRNKRKSKKQNGGGNISYTFDFNQRIGDMPAVVRV